MTTTEPQMTDPTSPSGTLAPHETRVESASQDRKLRNDALARASSQLMDTLDRERADSGYVPESGPSEAMPRPAKSTASPLLMPVVDEASPFIDDPLPDIEVSDDLDPPDPDHPSATDSAFGRRARVIDRDAGLSLVETAASATSTTTAPLTPPRLPDSTPEPEPLEAITLTIPEMIRELASLRDDGILTSAEFEETKQDLLTRI